MTKAELTVEILNLERAIVVREQELAQTRERLAELKRQRDAME